MEWKGAIRGVEDADSLDLIGLVARCWAQYPGCVLDVHGEERELLAPASSFAPPDHRMWVAEADGRVVGSVAVSPGPAPDSVFLRKLYVDPTIRRQGLGARLVGLVEEEAKARGASAVELWSDTRFTDAHRLYERLGYEKTGETRELHDRSETVELRYRKRL